MKKKKSLTAVYRHFRSGLFKICESCENMAVSTVILCLAVCVFDVMNNVCMCGKIVGYVISQPFSAVIGKEQINKAAS